MRLKKRFYEGFSWVIDKLFYLCWCDEVHYRGKWHDPTHGEIMRELQEYASAILMIPYYTSNRELRSQGQEHIIMVRMDLERKLQKAYDQGTWAPKPDWRKTYAPV